MICIWWYTEETWYFKAADWVLPCSPSPVLDPVCIHRVYTPLTAAAAPPHSRGPSLAEYLRLPCFKSEKLGDGDLLCLSEGWGLWSARNPSSVTPKPYIFFIYSLCPRPSWGIQVPSWFWWENQGGPTRMLKPLLFGASVSIFPHLIIPWSWNRQSSQ